MKLILPVILTFFVNAGFTQLSQCNQKFELYHCMGKLPYRQERAMEKNSIKAAKLIDGRYIDPESKNIFDSISFKKGVEQNFPDEKAIGVGILDWETKVYDNLCFQPKGSDVLENSIKQFSLILDIAKRLRPKVRWGIYSLPYYSYWQRKDINWQQQGEILRPLFEKVDILMLSLYDFYKDGSPSTNDRSYIEDNVKMGLGIAGVLKKPLYVFVWERYHDSNPTIGLNLISFKEFNNHLDYILQTKLNSQCVAGLVWFDSQGWFYKVKPLLSKTDAMQLGSLEGEETKDKVIATYASFISKRSKAAQKKRR